jgi:hypothetical protein
MLLITVVAAPSPAWASCTNPHVGSRLERPRATAHLSWLEAAGALSMPLDQAPPSRPAPCTGAFCSGNPAPPLSTLPPVPPQSGEEWAISVIAIISEGPGASAGLTAAPSLQPRLDHTSIFHPPRPQVTYPTH